MDKIVAKSCKSALITIANHLKGCGKNEIGEKAYKFFMENYIHDVFAKEEDGLGGTCEVKGHCYRSQKKNKTPYAVKLKRAEREGRGNVEGAECSCKAG